jgi:hypothetical protein
MNILNSIEVIIPQFQSHYVLSKSRRIKYRILKSGQKIISNKKTAGKPRLWRVNGQGMYNGSLNPIMRATITKYYHKYLEQFVILNLLPFDTENFPLSVSLDIYEIREDKIPDIGNLWIWLKWFEDVLTECEIIPDDNPTYIIENGPIKYIWVNNIEDRKLVFKIK